MILECVDSFDVETDYFIEKRATTYYRALTKRNLITAVIENQLPTIAIVKPTPPKIARTNALPRSHAFSGLSTVTLLMIVRQAKRIAQFVVIRGRNTPKDLYRGGKNFFTYISTN